MAKILGTTNGGCLSSFGPIFQRLPSTQCATNLLKKSLLFQKILLLQWRQGSPRLETLGMYRSICTVITKSSSMLFFAFLSLLFSFGTLMLHHAYQLDALSFEVRIALVIPQYGGNSTNGCSGNGYLVCGNGTYSSSCNTCGWLACNCTTPGWSGTFCEIPVCFGILANDTANVCSGRGTCVAPDVCSSCQTGFGGSRCQTPICYGKLANDTNNVCSGRGSCVGPDICSSCAAGYSGSVCQNPICYGYAANDTSKVCSGRCYVCCT